MQGPYHIFDGPGEQRDRALQCEIEYIKQWVKVVKEAEPVRVEQYRQYARQEEEDSSDPAASA